MPSISLKINAHHFVSVLKKFPDGATKNDLPYATRDEDKARQYARRSGKAVYEDRGKGKRWFAVVEENL